MRYLLCNHVQNPNCCLKLKRARAHIHTKRGKRVMLQNIKL
uniref:Uncharacterized protein n=1 Tax=Arundo donax TaxID=35708 RepID=A0A0A8YVV4_ARUDO